MNIPNIISAKTGRLALLLTMLLSLNSCINLIEEYHLNKDGSGTASLRLQAPSFTPLLMMAGQYIDNNWKNEILGLPAHADKKLSKIRGLSNIRTYTLGKEGKIGLSFAFERPSDLNKALYALLGKQHHWYYPKLISISPHRIKRRNIAPQIRQYLNDNKDHIGNIDYLKMVDYKIIYHLPLPATKIKNNDAVKLNEGHTVIQHYNLLTLLQTPVNMGNNIRFKSENIIFAN